jgi:hypothetical protein
MRIKAHGHSVGAVLGCVAVLVLVACSSGADHVSDATSCKEFLTASRDAQLAYASFARAEYNKRDALSDRSASLDLVRRAFVQMCRLDVYGKLTVGDVRANPVTVPLYVNDPASDLG